MAVERWPKVSSSTLADQVYAAIRDRIIAGELEAGHFAREQEISEAMGVSRTPVREALGRLATEGLLERLPHRGFRLPQESISRLLEVYPIVSALELLAGQLAFPKASAADLDELRGLNRRLAAAGGDGEVEGAIELNDRFHALIAEASGNQRLVALLDDLRTQLRPLENWYYTDPDHTRKSVEEHDALIDALATGELDRALSIFQRNMSLTITTLLQKVGSEAADSGAG
jgi:DNA-binding GntR family transcriptional regulator